jgi:AraC-like DNA-binding protein
MEQNNFFQYLPINQENIRWGLYLTGAGLCRVEPASPYPPKGHPDVYDFNWAAGRVLPEYQILLIAEGHGLFESSPTGSVPLVAGNVLLLFPGLWHRYRPNPQTGWKEYWLSWNGEYLYRLQRQGLLNPERAVLTAQNPDHILQAFERILGHVRTHPAENSSVLSAYAMEVLTLAIQNEQKAAVPRRSEKTIAVCPEHALDDPVVFNALQLIWNHSYRNFHVEDIVQKLPMTRRTLERRFRRSLGHSIGAEITRCRIERARHLLINTTLPIKHIALAVGYAGADRLGKAFRQETQQTPTQFRRYNRRANAATLDSSFNTLTNP